MNGATAHRAVAHGAGLSVWRTAVEWPWGLALGDWSWVMGSSSELLDRARRYAALYQVRLGDRPFVLDYAAARLDGDRSVFPKEVVDAQEEEIRELFGLHAIELGIKPRFASQLVGCAM